MANLNLQMAELKREVRRLREAVEAVQLADRTKIVEVVRGFLDDLEAGRGELEGLRAEVSEARREVAEVQDVLVEAGAETGSALADHAAATKAVLRNTAETLRAELKRLFTDWSASAAQHIGGTRKLADEARAATKDSAEAVKAAREELAALRAEVVDVRALQDGLRTDTSDAIRQLQVEFWRKLAALQQYERVNRAALAKIAEPKIDEEKGWLKKLLGK